MNTATDQTYAFQPIVNIIEKSVFSYEALRRKRFDDHPATRRYENIPQQALSLASELGIQTYLNINVSPTSLEGSKELVKRTLDMATKHKIGTQKLVIEITETEAVKNNERFKYLVDDFRAKGVKIAIDDFGAGYSGLNLLANFQPDMVKLDMGLIRNIQSHGPRQSIVRAIHQVCFELGIDLIAEGVETLDEYRWLRDVEIELHQGYLFAKPALEALPEIYYPEQ
jgi:blue light- and temperature-responsive anti-repressor